MSNKLVIGLVIVSLIVGTYVGSVLACGTGEIAVECSEGTYCVACTGPFNSCAACCSSGCGNDSGQDEWGFCHCICG